jgi:argininosuccinate lyase
MRAATETGFITATDLADWLVRKLALPFRNAHHVTGELVRRAESKGVGLDKLSLAELQAVEPRITEDIYTVLSAEHSAASRKSFGGTAPENVRAAAAAARERFL